MDPLTALGLAANILQFIDFSWGLVKSANEVHTSVIGTTRDSADLTINISRLEEVTRELQTPVSPNPRYQPLCNLSTQCQALSQELLEHLKSLVAKLGSKRSSALVAIRSFRKTDKIASLRGRLNEYRSQILLELAVLLKKDQSLFGDQLQTLSVSTDQLHAKLESLNTSISAELKLGTDQGIQGFKALHDDLILFRSTVQDEKQRYYILNALRFDKDEERFDQVKNEHSNTFEWIFEDGLGSEEGRQRQLRRELRQEPRNKREGFTKEFMSLPSHAKVSFNEWLQSGHGIFHILGKAGSGKSTLMKYIYDNPLTKDRLVSWSGDKKLVLCQFFFWKPGTPLQRSLKGLVRALLHSVLKQAPELIEIVFPTLCEQIKTTPWNIPCDISLTHVDVQAALEKIIKSPKVYESLRFCFFIDGLDEFDESNDLDAEQLCYSDLIKLLKNWTKDQPEVKICVSSRDWNLFNDAFITDQKLRLQDLTKNDMEALVEDTLKDSELDPQFWELVDQIVEKAEGVFLWVVLVLKSLRQGLQHKDSAKMLKARLEKMPAGLDKFLRFMLESIDLIYLPRSAQIFALAMSGQDWSLLRYSFLEDLENDHRYALDTCNFIDEISLQKRLECMRYQLDACCKGLLEVRNIREKNLPPCVWDRVTFTHRSIHDVLEGEPSKGETEKIQKLKGKILDARKGSSIHRDIVQTFLAEIKSIGSQFGYKSHHTLRPQLTDVTKSIQQIWSRTQNFDFEFATALDTVLQRPILGVTPNTRSCWGIIYPDYTFFVEESNEGLIYFADLFGTLALHGFSEFISKGINHDTGLICGRPIEQLLDLTLNGFKYSRPFDNLQCLEMTERLLSFKPNPNTILHDKYGNSNYCWETFSMLIVRSLPLFPDVGWFSSQRAETAQLFSLFLKHGVDPYVWIGDAFFEIKDHLVCYYRFRDGLIYTNNSDEKHLNPKKVLSLRECVERYSDQLAHTILPHLPSESEYKLEWKSRRIITRAEARELQGCVYLPEVKALVQRRARAKLGESGKTPNPSAHVELDSEAEMRKGHARFDGQEPAPCPETHSTLDEGPEEDGIIDEGGQGSGKVEILNETMGKLRLEEI